MIERLFCPVCFRIRFSPMHWLVRLMGVCDGRNGW